MTLLFICSTSINDIVCLNIFYNTLIKYTATEDMKIDLISTENQKNSNIFFPQDAINTHISYSISKTFFKDLGQINAENYDYVIKIGENFKSELIYKFLSSKSKIKTRFRFKKIFKSFGDYDKKEINQKCIELFDQLKNLNITEPIEPEMILNHSIYTKTFEIVNWFLKSSNQYTLTNHRFCFLYLDLNSESDDNTVFDLLEGLLDTKTMTIPVFSTLNPAVKKYLDKKTEDNPDLLISNFVLNNDQNHISLFLKYSKFVITNNISLKIASTQIQKKIIYYNFDPKKTFNKRNVISDLNTLNK